MRVEAEPTNRVEASTPKPSRPASKSAPPRAMADGGIAGELPPPIPADASISLPTPDLGPIQPSVSPAMRGEARQLGAPMASGLSLAPGIEKTLVQNPDGTVSPVDAIIQQPLKTLRSAQAQAAQPATKASSAGGAGLGRPGEDYAKELRAEREKQGAALDTQAELAKQNATASADLIRHQMAESAGIEGQQAAMAAAYQQRRAAEQQKYSDLVQKYSSADVDPTRFWASRSTGEKGLAAIGLVLGALGAGNDGVNRSVSIINDAINRDIDAQKFNIEKMGKTADQQSKLLGIMRSNFEDDSAAMAATRAAMLSRFSNQAAELAARASGPEQAAKLMQLKSTLSTQALQEAQKFDLSARVAGSTAAHERAIEGIERDKLALMGGKGQATEGAERAVDDYLTKLQANPAGFDIGRERQALKLEVQQAMGERASPEIMSMIDDIVPGRLGGVAGKLGLTDLRARGEQLKQAMRNAHQAKAGLSNAVMGAQ